MPISPSEPNKKPPLNPNPWVGAYKGLELVVGVLLGLYVGKWVDGKLGSQPWFLLAGVFIGFSVGIYQVIRKP